MTEECESVFPIKADGFLNFSEYKVSEGFVQFFLYNEQRVMDGLFSYEKFIDAVQQYNVRQFDADHILIPPLKKEQLEELAAKLR